MAGSFLLKQDGEFVCGICGKTNERYGPFKSHFVQAHSDKVEDGEVPWDEDLYSARTVILECEECGQEYERNANNADGSRFCSQDCMFEYSDRTNAYETEWKPEVTWSREHRGEDVNRGVHWNTQKELALSRDDAECQNRGHREYSVISYQIEVHHIVPARLFKNPDFAHSLVNLITLCSRCHGGWETEFRLLEDGGEPENPAIRRQIQKTMQQRRNSVLGESEQRLRADLRYWENL